MGRWTMWCGLYRTPRLLKFFAYTTESLSSPKKDEKFSRNREIHLWYWLNKIWVNFYFQVYYLFVITNRLCSIELTVTHTPTTYLISKKTQHTFSPISQKQTISHVDWGKTQIKTVLRSCSVETRLKFSLPNIINIILSKVHFKIIIWVALKENIRLILLGEKRKN